MAFTVTVEVEAIKPLVDYLNKEDAWDPYSPRAESNIIALKELLEAGIIVEKIHDEVMVELDSVSEYLLDKAVEDIIIELSPYLKENMPIAIVPMDMKGTVLIVFTEIDELVKKKSEKVSVSIPGTDVPVSLVDTTGRPVSKNKEVPPSQEVESDNITPISYVDRTMLKLMVKKAK